MRKRIQRGAFAAFLLSAAQLAQAAPDYFRLEPGSVRVYRAQTSESTFTISVSAVGTMHNGHVHYRVSGYVDQPVLVYRDDATGALYYLDNDSGNDVLLTSLEKGPGWREAPLRGCESEGRVAEAPVSYRGPSGHFPNALAIGYRSFGCADTGVAQESYAENVGLVQRTVQTFAGPVQYDLVHASVGQMQITEAPSATFSLSLRRPLGPRVIAQLRLNAVGEGAVLTMPTSQNYDVVLRNAKGDEVWRWSQGQFFLPQLRTRTARQLSFEVEIPLQYYGILLQEGVYTVEAWLTTIPERQFAAATQFTFTYPARPGSSQN